LGRKLLLLLLNLLQVLLAHLFLLLVRQRLSLQLRL
jgi:hypothetical protein